MGPRSPQESLLASPLRRDTASKSCRWERRWLAEVSWDSCRSAPLTRLAWFPSVCMERLFGDFCLPRSQAPSCPASLSSLPSLRNPRRLLLSLRMQAQSPPQCDSDNTILGEGESHLCFLLLTHFSVLCICVTVG